MPIASMSTAFNTPAAAAQNYGSFPQVLPQHQKSSGTSSSSGYVDPFGDAAYQEWMTSMGRVQQQQQQQGHAEPQTIWPGAVTRNSSKQSGHDGGLSIVPDYLASTMDQNMGTDQLGMSGFAMDEDTLTTNLKVPTNTPIGAADGSAAPMGTSCDTAQMTGLWRNKLTYFFRSGQFGYDFPTPAISGELAHSLTHSLLNQPHPLHQFAQPHQIPLPASEVRSRKENRHLNNASSGDSPSCTASPSVEAQIRKFSQTSNAFGVIGQDRDSSGTGPTFSSRRTSAGEFGVDITNHTPTPSQTYAGVAASGAAPGSGSDKGTKRSRTFTPASAKAIDEEDEPRRASPKMRTGSPVPGGDEAATPADE